MGIANMKKEDTSVDVEDDLFLSNLIMTDAREQCVPSSSTSLLVITQGE